MVECYRCVGCYSFKIPVVCVCVCVCVTLGSDREMDREQYSVTSDEGPSEKGTTSLQRTLFRTPFPYSSSTFLTSEKRTISQ